MAIAKVAALIGRPCSGKTSVARGLEHLNPGVRVLDICVDLASEIARARNAEGVEWVVLDGIPPHVESLRELLSERAIHASDSILVHIDTPVEDCIRRGATQLGCERATKTVAEMSDHARAVFLEQTAISCGQGPLGLERAIVRLAQRMGAKD